MFRSWPADRYIARRSPLGAARAARSFRRTIDTSQLKCDVCPLFKPYNVFCSPTHVELWPVHQLGRKRCARGYGNLPIPSNASRIEPEPLNRVPCQTYAAGLFRNEGGRSGAEHGFLVPDLNPLEISRIMLDRRVKNPGPGRVARTFTIIRKGTGMEKS